MPAKHCCKTDDHENAIKVDCRREAVLVCFVITVPSKTDTALSLRVDAKNTFSGPVNDTGIDDSPLGEGGARHEFHDVFLFHALKFSNSCVVVSLSVLRREFIDFVLRFRIWTIVENAAKRGVKLGCAGSG